MTANHPGSGIWQSAPRVEDEQLLRGQAQFLDDVPMDDACHACFVRSAQAHARIVSVDTTQARGIPGVVGVFVKQDLFGELTSWRMPLGFALAALPENTTPFVLVDHEVAFVGEAIAVVVASSRHVAEDAASRVQVHYEPLPVVANCRDAVRPDSPTVRTELSSNVLQRYTLAYGSVDEEFAKAPVLISEDFWAHRGGGHPMEGRGVLAKVEKSTGTLMVWSSTQMAHELHYTLALMLGQPEERLRVITPEVGGGFGAKFMIYPEEVVIPALARKLGRP
ncbi:MAG: xanthine dehydrogenase family protein molybdopterin-binding subunit, partial [Limnohabitans sp.]